MTADARYKLFFLRGNPSFPDGTLFELEPGESVIIPDRGDGLAVTAPRESLVEIRPFAENVPPGQCPVKVTSIDGRKPTGARVDTSIHYQVIEVLLPDGQFDISSVTVIDRVKDFEADRYEASNTGEENGRPVYRLHIGHLPPGFYEATIEFPEHAPCRMTFIKFFPDHFTGRYVDLAVTEDRGSYRSVPERAAAATAVVEPHRSGEPFSDELLNLALKLATEWGENFRKPIHERIRITHPELTDPEIDELTAIVSKAESRIYALAEEEMEGKITEFEIVPQAMREFPWLGAANASRLANIGMYYARR